MKGILSIVALVLIVVGFAVIVLGYSPTSTPTNQDTNQTNTNQTYPHLPTPPNTETPPENPNYPYVPPAPTIPHWPPGITPEDVYGVQFEITFGIGIILILAGLALIALGGKH